jgi:hypothetical protein
VKLDSLLQQGMGSTQIFRELRVQFPHLKEAIIQPVIVNNDTLPGPTTGYLVLLRMSQGLGTEESQKVEQWLKVRLKESRITLVIDDLPASP